MLFRVNDIRPVTMIRMRSHTQAEFGSKRQRTNTNENSFNGAAESLPNLLRITVKPPYNGPPIRSGNLFTTENNNCPVQFRYIPYLYFSHPTTETPLYWKNLLVPSDSEIRKIYCIPSAFYTAFVRIPDLSDGKIIACLHHLTTMNNNNNNRNSYCFIFLNGFSRYFLYTFI